MMKAGEGDHIPNHRFSPSFYGHTIQSWVFYYERRGGQMNLVSGCARGIQGNGKNEGVWIPTK